MARILALFGACFFIATAFAPENRAFAASDTASADDVVVTTAWATYRIKHLELAGTSLTNADLAALLDAKSTTPLSERLSKLQAASVSIPEMVAEIAVQDGKEKITFRDLRFTNVAGGKVGTMSAAGAALTLTNSKAADLNGTMGAIDAKNVDLVLSTRMASETRSDANEPKKPLYDSFNVAGLKLTSAQNHFEASVGKIGGSGAKGRPLSTNPIELGASLSDAARPSGVADKAGTAAKTLADLFGSIEVGALTADDMTLRLDADGKPVVVTLARSSLSQPEDGKIGEIAFEKLGIGSNAAKITLGSFVVRGLDLAPLQKELADAAAGSNPNRTQTLPPLTQLVLSDLNVDVADAKHEGNGPGGERDLFKVTKLEMNGSNPVAGVPTRFAAQLDHFLFDLPKSREGSFKDLVAMGYGKLDLSSRFSLAWREETKELIVDDLSLNGLGMGALKISAQLGNVSKDLFSSDPAVMQAAALSMLVKKVGLRIDNAGLVDKTLAFLSKGSKATPEEIKQQYVAAAAVGIPVMLGNGPGAKTIGAALAKFVASPKSLNVIAASAEGLGASDLALINDPATLLSKLDVQATANE